MIFDTGSSDVWVRAERFVASDSESFVDLEYDAEVGGPFEAGFSGGWGIQKKQLLKGGW